MLQECTSRCLYAAWADAYGDIILAKGMTTADPHKSNVQSVLSPCPDMCQFSFFFFFDRITKFDATKE